MTSTSSSSSRDHNMQDTAEPAWEFNGLLEEGRITVESAELSSLGGNEHYKDNSRNQDNTRNHNDNINCSSKHHKLEERCNETSSLSSFEEDDDNGDADDDLIKEDEEEKEVAMPLAFPTTNTAAVAAAVSHPQQRERKWSQKSKSIPKSDEQSADELLVYELNQLSFQERNTINEEVHGVFTGDNSYYPTETPELIQTALLELEKELQLLPPKHKQAYALAQQLYPTTTFINTAKFRLIFLRCELFDPKLAAKRLVSYLDLCYEVVVESSSNNNNSSSNNILERGILNVSDDFDEQDKQFLGSGDFQMLPKRDRSGRRITCNIASDIVINNEGGNVNPNAIITCRIKSALMMMMRLAMEEDIMSIQRGVVGVFWTHNITHKNDIKTRSIVRSKMVKAIPIRYSSLHICFSVGGNASDNYTNFVSKFMHQTTNNAIQLGLKSMHLLSIGKQMRPRLRMHTGSPVECLYALQSFGIPSVLMPIDRNSGRVTTKDHRKFIQHILNAEHIMKQEQQQKNLIENSTTIMTAAMTTTNNKKQKYHDHYQQPLVAEEKEQKILNKKARKEHNNVKPSVNMKKSHFEKQRDHKETMPSQSKSPLASHIEYPEQNDILFGRGWDIQNRPGNLLFRRVLESYLNEYNNLESKKAKTTFACSITRELKGIHQCRFLMKDPTQYGCWNEVTDKVARQKVSIGLRDIRKTRVKNNIRCTTGQAAATSNTYPDHTQSGEHSSNTASSKRKYVDPILSDPIPIIGSTSITNDGNGRDFDMPWHDVEEIIGGEQDIILPGVYDRNDHSSNYCNNVNNDINNSNNVDNNNNHNGGSYAFLNSRDQSRQFYEKDEETKNNNGTDKQCFSWF